MMNPHAKCKLKSLENFIEAINTQQHPFWLRQVDEYYHGATNTLRNNTHTSCMLTKVIDESGKITFLDYLFTRNNNCLRTTVYRKPTHKDRLNQTTYNPTTHQTTTVQKHKRATKNIRSNIAEHHEFKNNTHYLLGLCKVLNLLYELLPTPYT